MLIEFVIDVYLLIDYLCEHTPAETLHRNPAQKGRYINT